MTMRCKQTLVRVKARVRARRLQLLSKLEQEWRKKIKSQMNKFESEQWDRTMSRMRDSPIRKLFFEVKRERESSNLQSAANGVTVELELGRRMDE
ncbi:hypothetical protein SASPL_149304 [Salvia splendens]|uniref:Uncharacterized protein n=1 Tax=Salvia splendens TaxID=180675 RepID=A0A8X8WBW6_SALSN|nr:hypothetical protein SASPL_149304 [Salvia splendens]